MVDAMDESQTYNIVVDKNIGQSDIFALKLTDDVIQRISAGQTDLKHLKGIEFVSATTGDVQEAAAGNCCSNGCSF